MFSKGQIIFAIVFAISFVIIVTIAYRKDSKIHKKYYRGNLWVLLAFYQLYWPNCNDKIYIYLD